MTMVPDGDLGADFDQRFEEALAVATQQVEARRDVEVDTIGRDVLALLAMAPTWTPAVLDASGLASATVLDTLSGAGLMVKNGERYTVPEDQARAALADPRVAGAAPTMLDLLQVVADGVLKARQAKVDAPAVLNRFAQLTAAASTPAVVAERLLALVEAALAVDNQAEAVNWIEAAARLELTLGRQLAGARLRAGRLVARKRRDDEVATFSSSYFPRQRYETQLLRLLDNTSRLWARHLRGDGGTGKTMLVRWLEAQFPSDGSAGSVARIDFDYLHPNYPGTEPGLLMLTLAAQLRFFAGPEAATRFDRLERHISDWHARIEEAERTHPADVPAIRARRAGLVQAAFSDAVATLPSPTVVILDTTEELEKAAGGQANVAAALDVVTRLHEASPAVRVVLSGRRALPLPHGAEEIPIRGFSNREARSFVRWFGVDAARTNAIVNRVSQTAHGGDLNPFDLSLLATWASEDTGLDTAAISAMDEDFYVRHRIVDRLDDDMLEQVLPVIVALGRFDMAILGGVTGLDGAALDHLQAALSKQEWISLEFDLMVVDPHLQARLRTYLDSTRRVAWTQARRQAGAFLRRHSVESPRSAVTVEHLVGAIELTEEDDGVDLLGWWERIEDRSRAEAAFGWLQQVTALLLGAHGAVGHDHQLAGPVTASYVACLDHESPDPAGGHHDLWAEVYAKATPGSRASARAAARLPAEVGTAVSDWADRLDEQLAASFVAGLERIVPTGPDLIAPTIRLYEATVDRGIGPELLAVSALLVGLAQARHGTKRAAQRWLDRAVQLADTVVGAQQGNEWIDWPVEDVGARIRLSASWAWWQRFGDADDAAHWLSGTTMSMTVDQDRAESLKVIIGLATGHPAPAVAATTAGPVHRARVPVHLRVPSLDVSTALLRARSGAVDDALTNLQSLASQHRSPEEYLMAERARILLIRRYRLRDLGDGLSSGLADSGDPQDVALLADLDAFDGDKVTTPIWVRSPATTDPVVLHAWWRTVRAGHLPLGSTLFHPRHPPPTTPAEAHRALDSLELALLTDEPAPVPPPLQQWTDTESDDPETALRLALRESVLTGRPPANLARLARRVGINQAAEIAMDEGDSLALRLPRQAVAILVRAAAWFDDADDAAGAVRARAAAAIAALCDGTGHERPNQHVSALRDAYTAAAAVVGLPAPTELPKLDPTASTQIPRAWQPWFLRCGAVDAVHSSESPDLWIPIVQPIVGTVDARKRPLLPAEFAALIRSQRAGGRRPDRPRPESPIDAPPLVEPVVLEIDGVAGSTVTEILRTGTVHITRHDPDGRVHPARALDVPAGPQAAATLAELTAGIGAETPIELLHTGDVAAVSWEALFGAVSERPHLTRPIWRRLKRWNRRPPWTPHSEWPTGILTGEPVLAQCWEPHPVIQGPAVASHADSPDLSSARVVHLVGDPAESRSGVAFPFAPTAKSPRWTKMYRERYDISASELLGRWYQAELVIVQGPPDIEPELDTWSREQAAYLRQLGSDFAQEGVRAVIVLPGFAEIHWMRVSRAVTTALRLPHTDELTHDQLLRAVATARDTLLEGGGLREVEDAAAICLFISESLTR